MYCVHIIHLFILSIFNTKHSLFLFYFSCFNEYQSKMLKAVKILFSHKHVYIVHACICRFLHGNKADFSFNYVIYKKYISFQISFQIFSLFLFKVIVKLQWLSLKEPIATSPAFPETPEILRLSRNISFCLSLNPFLSISPSILFFFFGKSLSVSF